MRCGRGVITYNNGTAAFTVGRTVTGQTSKAKGVITAKTGTVSSGTLTVWGIAGTFQNGEIIKDNRATPGSAQVNGSPVMSLSQNCCFEMGGCNDSLRPYPPPRGTTAARAELDPSLTYDLSDYGHLGYNPASGAPNPNAPVQNQYTGRGKCTSQQALGQRLGRCLRSISWVSLPV